MTILVNCIIRSEQVTLTTPQKGATWSQMLRRSTCLLIGLPFVSQPATHMTPLRVVVGPMDDPTFFVPFIDAVELHHIALPQATNARGQIDIVGDEEGIPRGKAQDELLVAASFVVIGEDATDRGRPADLDPTLPILEGTKNFCTVVLGYDRFG